MDDESWDDTSVTSTRNDRLVYRVGPLPVRVPQVFFGPSSSIAGLLLDLAVHMAFRNDPVKVITWRRRKWSPILRTVELAVFADGDRAAVYGTDAVARAAEGRLDDQPALTRKERKAIIQGWAGG